MRLVRRPGVTLQLLWRSSIVPPYQTAMAIAALRALPSLGGAVVADHAAEPHCNPLMSATLITGRRMARRRNLGCRKKGGLSELAGRNAYALQGFPAHVRLEFLHTR
jgi:hypothetical protein